MWKKISEVIFRSCTGNAANHKTSHYILRFECRRFSLPVDSFTAKVTKIIPLPQSFVLRCHFLTSSLQFRVMSSKFVTMFKLLLCQLHHGIVGVHEEVKVCFGGIFTHGRVWRLWLFRMFKVLFLIRKQSAFNFCWRTTSHSRLKYGSMQLLIQDFGCNLISEWYSGITSLFNFISKNRGVAFLRKTMKLPVDVICRASAVPCLKFEFSSSPKSTLKFVGTPFTPRYLFPESQLHGAILVQDWMSQKSRCKPYDPAPFCSACC